MVTTNRIKYIAIQVKIMIYEQFKMCFALEGATDFVSVMLNIYAYKTVYFTIMSRGHCKKHFDK